MRADLTAASTILILILTACAGNPPDNRVPEPSARAAALAAVPGATVKGEELESEGGRWIYSYDLVVAGQPGVEEVHVDAITGKLLAREHEGEGQEAAEQAEERGRAGEAVGAGEGDEVGEAAEAGQAGEDGQATEAAEAGEAGESAEVTSTATQAPVTEPYAPMVVARDFVAGVDNVYFPLVPGTVYRYESTNGGRNVVTVMDGTRAIQGIAATVVLDQEYGEDGALAEETYDWYAQDRTDNVWYLGEDSRELKAGRVVSTSGSWQAGEAGAKPGLIMPAHPAVGQAYRQEYRKDVAEDQGRVEAVGVSARVPYGSFRDCIRTVDTSPLEPFVRETKLYCRGVGLVQENEGPGVVNRLVSVERQ